MLLLVLLTSTILASLDVVLFLRLGARLLLLWQIGSRIHVQVKNHLKASSASARGGGRRVFRAFKARRLRRNAPTHAVRPAWGREAGIRIGRHVQIAGGGIAQSLEV